MNKYDPKKIESKWQKIWEDTGLYKVDFASKKPKYYGFGMFNYPSGAGIHVGHVRNYTIPDVMTRFKRQQGFESYQPIGWDSFGLPAENYAIKTGVSPQESTKAAITKYQEQYRAMGWAVDWSKEINTTDPEYYKWTQWIFTKLFEEGLAYQAESAQWWCDQCKTVLADEQVIAGKCWRHESADDPLVTKRNLKQWFFKITEYADEILKATDKLDWTQSVKASQKSWIGKSNGANIDFAVQSSKASPSDKLQVYTTRPDTIFGATFIVIAPEHELVATLTSVDQKAEVEAYISATSIKTEVERQEAKEKTGVFTGSYVTNPANNEQIPVWVADYVLTGYGTGAIMAVPAHDERDNEFAKKYGLPIVPVIDPVTGERQTKPLHKEKIVALLTNKKGEVLTINWGPKLGGRLLVGGSVEDGEDPLEAAIREIVEETGYTDIELRAKADERVHHEYFAFSKNQATVAHTDIFHFILKSDTRKDQVLEENEKDKFVVEWVTAEKAKAEIEDDQHLYVLNKFVFDELWVGDGTLCNSAQFNGMSIDRAKQEITDWLAGKNLAQPTTQYKMRDWLVSRQRYWGAPIPIIHCDDHGPVAVPEKDLPVVLPEIKNYRPTGDNISVLAGVDDWVNVPCPDCGKPARRETDTLDGYVCSSWYFLRYLDPNSDKQPWQPERASTWMPVDFYNGADHATAHLLYARFFTRFFHTLGLIDNPEPFTQMVYNGKVKASDGSAFSKTLGNGVDPLEVIEQGHGADALRLYEMFAAPVEQDVLWDPQGIGAMVRFLSRVWVLCHEYLNADTSSSDPITSLAIVQTAHKTIKKVTRDIEDHKFNTAIAAMMQATNDYYKHKQEYGVQRSQEWQLACESLLQLLAPFAPHITEELWQQFGHDQSIHVDSWPEYDPKLVKDDVVTIVVQVNGKLKGEFVATTGADHSELEKMAIKLNNDNHLTGEDEIRKIVVVPNRLVNFVTSK